VHVADKLMVDLIEIWAGPSSDPVYGREIIPSARSHAQG
jgi:hypothetical protein